MYRLGDTSRYITIQRSSYTARYIKSDVSPPRKHPSNATGARTRRLDCAHACDTSLRAGYRWIISSARHFYSDGHLAARLDLRLVGLVVDDRLEDQARILIPWVGGGFVGVVRVVRVMESWGSEGDGVLGVASVKGGGGTTDRAVRCGGRSYRSILSNVRPQLCCASASFRWRCGPGGAPTSTARWKVSLASAVRLSACNMHAGVEAMGGGGVGNWRLAVGG